MGGPGVPFQVTCSSCNGTFNAPDSAANKTTKCPKCGGLIQLTPPAEAEVFDAEMDTGAEAAATATDGGGDRKPCPMCGEMIQQDALKCRFCGEIFDPVLAKAQRMRGPGPQPGESVEAAAKRLMAEQQDKTTALQLFITSLLGCFSPILLIYGIVFLVRRPYPFPRKGLAIAGTIIHGFWTLVLIASIIAGQSQH